MISTIGVDSAPGVNLFCQYRGDKQRKARENFKLIAYCIHFVILMIINIELTIENRTQPKIRLKSKLLSFRLGEQSGSFSSYLVLCTVFPHFTVVYDLIDH